MANLMGLGLVICFRRVGIFYMWLCWPMSEHGAGMLNGKEERSGFLDLCLVVGWRGCLWRFLSAWDGWLRTDTVLLTILESLLK